LAIEHRDKTDDQVTVGAAPRHRAALTGQDQPSLNTRAFLATVDENLQEAMK
jgi:hypothetical protein